MILRYQQQAPA